jgi:hypothetical protein
MKKVVENIAAYTSCVHELEIKLKSMGTDDLEKMQRTIERILSHKQAISNLKNKLKSLQNQAVSSSAPPPKPAASLLKPKPKPLPPPKPAASLLKPKPTPPPPKQPLVAPREPESSVSTHVSIDGIRVGSNFQAELPQATDASEERGDILCSSKEAKSSTPAQKMCGTPGCNLPDYHPGSHSFEIVRGTRSKQTSCCSTVPVKKRKQCGTPGCNLPDMHDGPHSTEMVEGKRQRVENKKFTEPEPEPEPESDPEPEPEPEPEKQTPSGMEVDTESPRTTTSGSMLFNGSEAKLVPMDDRRRKIMCDLAIKNGREFGGDDAGVDQCCDLFKYTLFEKGYSEGSVTENGKYRCDGNPYKFPRYLQLFMNSGVFEDKSDLFKTGARLKAEKYAKSNAMSFARGTKKYAGATDAGKQKIIRKVYTNLMLGFDTFVELCK